MDRSLSPVSGYESGDMCDMECKYFFIHSSSILHPSLLFPILIFFFNFFQHVNCEQKIINQVLSYLILHVPFPYSIHVHRLSDYRDGVQGKYLPIIARADYQMVILIL